MTTDESSAVGDCHKGRNRAKGPVRYQDRLPGDRHTNVASSPQSTSVEETSGHQDAPSASRVDSTRSVESKVRVALVGAGAFGVKHLEALSRIEEVEVVAVASRTIEQAREVAMSFGIEVATANYAEVINTPGIEAIILCSPTPLHAEQTVAALRNGKHVQVEIPLAEDWTGANNVAQVARETGLICMVGHTRRFNPPHQWIHRRVLAKELSLQHLQVQTFFHRRTNTNALGHARSWVDNLLWHHAAHTIDLFAYQCGEAIVEAHAIAGPPHEALHIPMDMSIHLKSESGRICSLALSFNNEGPIGTGFRYICDKGTYVARYDQLFDGDDQEILISDAPSPPDGVELQDREFISAIREGRSPNSSVDSVIDCYRTLGQLQRQLHH